MKLLGSKSVSTGLSYSFLTFYLFGITYALHDIFIWIYLFNASLDGSMMITCLIFFFLGITMYFASAFFKRGYQLQSENDLTI